jgi:hypothetical protein
MRWVDLLSGKVGEDLGGMGNREVVTDDDQV